MPIAKRRSSSRRARAVRKSRHKLPYHRDDLRGDLMAAARAHVAGTGHSGLSIRLLAQAIGVSPGAPYHHFPDRRSLLLALAIEGFQQLMAAAAAVADSRCPGLEQLRHMGLVFIRFTDDHPQLAELMYESELTAPALDPALLEFQLQGHKLLKRMILEAQPSLSADEVNLRAIAYWSAVYGFASMRRKGVLHPHRAAGIDTLDIAEQLVDRIARASVAAQPAGAS
jgi:AcrR family transcriptional regulator